MCLLPNLKPLKLDPCNPHGERRTESYKFSFGLHTHKMQSQVQTHTYTVSQPTNQSIDQYNVIKKKRISNPDELTTLPWLYLILLPYKNSVVSHVPFALWLSMHLTSFYNTYMRKWSGFCYLLSHTISPVPCHSGFSGCYSYPSFS